MSLPLWDPLDPLLVDDDLASQNGGEQPAVYLGPCWRPNPLGLGAFGPCRWACRIGGDLGLPTLDP